MSEDRFKQYEPFFGKWKYRKELGKGSFGQVLEIYWDDDLGSRSVSALKFIHIPADEALRIQMEEQPNKEAVRNYFLKQVERIKDEIRILQRCKGHSNIVSYEDHIIIENVGEYGIGWDILIRMELLYPLNPYFSRPEATQYDILQMWADIANALVYCDEQNIIHRDIKPANILRASSGRYKLSDFGVARKNMQDIGASTRVGTERYMAPEVFKNEKYDKRADYYSLGCVIYYYLNKRRHVFMPPYPHEVTADDNEQAERKRVSGEKIPRIDGVSKEINNILLKSMAYRPANRYKSAKELYRAIQNVLETQGKELQKKYLNDENTPRENSQSISPRKGSSVLSRTSWSVKEPEVSLEEYQKKRKGMFGPIALAGALLVVGACGIVYGIYSKNNTRQTLSGDRKGISTAEIQPLTEMETIAETKRGALTVVAIETEAVIEAVTEAMTESVTEVMTESVTEAMTESGTESVTEAMTEAGTEAMTESGTEAMTEARTEAMTESGTEAMTEAGTEAITEAETEAMTEAETEVMTEAETEAVIEAMTETETKTETETEKPIPTTPVLGELERPRDGDTLDSDIKLKGWILANNTVGDLKASLNLLLNGNIVKSFELDKKVASENTFEKRRKKYEGEIAAEIGYELKGTYLLDEIDDGSYEIAFCVTDPESGLSETLETAKINIERKNAGDGNIMDYLGLTEEEKELDTHYFFDEKNYSIGFDVDADSEITVNAEQILLTGWINSEKGTSVGMYLDIDSEIYTADTLAERGGEMEIVRVPRNLGTMDSGLIGSTVYDTGEAGCIVILRLPFLEDGVHTIAVSFNIGVPGSDSELVDIKPLTVCVDSSVKVDAAAAEQITAEWAKNFPKENETESEIEENIQ